MPTLPACASPCRRARRSWRAVLLALLLSIMGDAAAGAVPKAAVMRLLSEQSAWLAEQIAYPAPALPGVGFEPQAALQRRCFPDFPEPLGVCIKGAYDPRDGIIYLDVDLDVDDPVDQSYLLHELVHHFQVHQARRHARDDVAPRPRGRLEGEAYRLQLRWLEHVGIAKPFEALGLDERTLQLIERSLR